MSNVFFTMYTTDSAYHNHVVTEEIAVYIREGLLNGENIVFPDSLGFSNFISAQHVVSAQFSKVGPNE